MATTEKSLAESADPHIALASAGHPAFDHQRPVFDIGAQGQTIDSLPGVLKAAYDRKRPVLLYVHGRGDEPRKSFDATMTGGGAVPRLEAEFGVAVVMMNWQSKASGKNRSVPLGHVPAAADNLFRTLTKLKAFREANPTLPPPSLLVHSMGSIVLARTILDHGWPTTSAGPLFGNILLSEPDADSQGHAAWLSPLAAGERVFVTQNRKDSVLKESSDARSPESNFALGLDPVEPLAAGASYVDLTDALRLKRIAFLVKIGAHQIFRKNWMGYNVGTCLFVGRALRGDRIDFAKIPGALVVAPGRIRFSASKDKAHECFKSADMNDSDDD